MKNAGRIATVLCLLSTPWLLGADGGCSGAPTPPPSDETVLGLSDLYLGNAPGQATCTASYGMVGYEPIADGRYPVFFFMHGTFGDYRDAFCDVHIKEMARRGFVAVALQYDNGLGLSCDELQRKAECTFGSTQASSAVARVCARPKADCARGIVVGGLSQGAAMAVLARDHNAAVRAAYALGASKLTDHDTTGAYSCGDAGRRALPVDRLRIIHGESDALSSLAQIVQLSGVSCPPEQHDCLQPDGSGYYTVLDSEAQDGNAGHCVSAYAPREDCAGNVFDVGWAPPAMNRWSLLPNLDWLASFADR